MERKVVCTPKFGWSEMFENERLRISYIDDAPLDILHSILYALQNKRAFLHSYDAEGYEWTILSPDFISLYCIIRDSEEETNYPDTLLIPMSFRDFVEGLVSDIKADLEDWSKFPASIEISMEHDGDESEKDEQRANIEKAIENIESELVALDTNNICLVSDNVPFDVVEYGINVVDENAMFSVTIRDGETDYTFFSFDDYVVECLARRGDKFIVVDLDTKLSDFLNIFVEYVLKNFACGNLFPKHISNDSRSVEDFCELFTKLKGKYAGFWYVGAKEETTHRNKELLQRNFRKFKNNIERTFNQ